MNCVEEVLENLKANKEFIDNVKKSIEEINKGGKIDQYDIPQIIFLITDSYNQMSKLRVSTEELPELLEKLYTYIVEEFELIPVDKRSDFDKLVDVAINLIMMQPKVQKQVSRCLAWAGCMGSNSTVPQTSSAKNKNQNQV